MPATGRVKKLTPAQRARVRRELAQRKRAAAAPAKIAPSLAAATSKPSKAKVKEAGKQIIAESRSAMRASSGKAVLERSEKHNKLSIPVHVAGVEIGRINPAKAGVNLLRQIKNVPSEVGPGLVELAKAPAKDVVSAARATSDTVKAWQGMGTRKRSMKAGVPIPAGKNEGEGDFNPKHSIGVGKAIAGDLKYLATPTGPVVLRYDEKGRKIYRAKTGGETLIKADAKTGILAKAQERPLDYLLLGRGAGLAAGRTAARVSTKLGGDLERPGTIALRTRSGAAVTKRTSPNPIRRTEQKAVRGATVAVGRAVEKMAGRELPIGEHARAVRLDSRRKRRQERADIGRATAPFDKAFRGLSGAEKVAVVLHSQRVKPSEMRDFVQKQRAEAEAAGRGGEVKDHDRMLKLLDRVGDDLYDSVDTDVRLSGARARAGDLEKAGGDLLEAAEKLSPESRLTRPYLTKRVVEGARYQYPHVTQTRLREVAKTEKGLAGEAKKVKRKVTKAVKAGPQTEAYTLAKTHNDQANMIAQQHRKERSAARDEVHRRDRALERAEESLTFAQVRAAEGASKMPVLQRARQVQEAKMALDKAKKGLKDSIREGQTVVKVQEAAKARLDKAEADAKEVQQQGLAKHDKDLGRISRERARLGEQRAVIKGEAEKIAGGPDLEGLKAEIPDVIRFPHTGAKLREGQVPKRRAGSVPVKPPDSTKQSKAVRLLGSRYLPSPSAWRDDFVHAISYMHAKARGELAMRAAIGVGDNLEKNQGWSYVRLDGAPKPSRAAKERGDLDAEFDEFVSGKNDMSSFLRDKVVSHDAADVKRWLEENPKARIGQISEADFKEIFGEFKRSDDFVRRYIDRPTDFWRALTLNYRPAWVVNNIVGQNLLYAVNNFGPGGGKAYARAVLDESKDLGYLPEELRQGGFTKTEQRASGGKAESVIASPGTGNKFKSPISRETLSAMRLAEREIRDVIGRVNSAVSDNVPRRAAFYKIADKERKLYNRLNKTSLSRDEFLKALQDSKGPKGDARLSKLHDDIVENVLDELIDFSNLTMFERNVIRRMIPFYSWIKGSTMASVKLGINKPGRAAVLALIAEQGQTEREIAFGKGKSVLEAVDPIGKAVNRGRGLEQDVAGTAGMSPYQTTGDVIGMAQSLISGESDTRDNPFLSFNPMAQGLGEAAFHRDIFTGKTIQGGILEVFAKGLLTSFPQVSTIRAAASPESPTKDDGTPKVTVPGVKYRGVPSELLRYAGLPVSRKNIDAAKTVAEERANRKRTPEQRAYREVMEERNDFYAKAKEAGFKGKKLPAPLIASFNRKAAISAVRGRAEAKYGSGLPYQKSAREGEMRLLVQWGVMPKGELEPKIKWLQEQTEREVVEEARLYIDKLLAKSYRDLIGVARKELEKAGAKFD